MPPPPPPVFCKLCLSCDAGPPPPRLLLHTPPIKATFNFLFTFFCLPLLLPSVTPYQRGFNHLSGFMHLDPPGTTSALPLPPLPPPRALHTSLICCPSQGICRPSAGLPLSAQLLHHESLLLHPHPPPRLVPSFPSAGTTGDNLTHFRLLTP